MEYVDGEGTAAARATIEAHLADCAACRALVDEQRGLTATLGSWHVAPAPESLNAPVARLARTWWRPSRTVAAGVAAAAVVVVGLVVQQRPRSSAPGATVALGGPGVSAQPVLPDSIVGAGGGVQEPAGVSSKLQARPAAESLAAARQADRPSPVAPRGPSVIRTARLQIVTRDFATARESVESVVNANGGFVDDLTVTGDTAQARVLRGTLRVRSDRFRDALGALRALGIVLEDTQGTQDVTDQIVDLDARLAGARATEERLTELLRNRAGRLSDVLEVERELTRVRVEIERLDAEKTNVTRRVSYGTITITVTEERKESLDGPLPLTARLKVAALDGIEAALDTIAATVLFVLRAGPSLVLWGGLFFSIWLLLRRIRDSRSAVQDPR
jgi:hypothetical protein